MLGEREGLASQLLSRRSIGHVFSLRRGKRRRLNNKSTQSESLDYHTIHNRASLRALGSECKQAVPTESYLRVIVCASIASLQLVHKYVALAAQACTLFDRNEHWLGSGVCLSALSSLTGSVQSSLSWETHCALLQSPQCGCLLSPTSFCCIGSRAAAYVVALL